jgi:hypothetical protein
MTLSLLLVACGAKITGEIEPEDGSFGDAEDTASPDEEGGEGDPEEEDTGLTEEELAYWAGARLEILSPGSGDFLPLGEDAEFEARVVDAEGDDAGITELAWASDVGDWTGAGAAFEDDGLEPGLHTLTVSAVLPDGSRLTNAVGGVRVQAETAGTWVGNLLVDATTEYQGTPITASCIGATVVEVGVEGEGGEGESTCIISLLGFDTELNHVFRLEFDGDDITGEAAIDLFGFELAFDAAGQIDGDQLEVGWEGTLAGFADLAGTLTMEHISRDAGGLD